MPSFKPIIGIEVHVELKTASKMFCSCQSEYFQAEPNTHTCPICLGLPGALPAPNKQAIEWTIMLGLALDCEIPLLSKFDRKNYFYPDLPKGYQISQYDAPLARNGKWQMPACPQSRANGKLIRIRRVHLEEDTGKLIHKGDATLIDFNRSGVPLVEIVTDPDMNSTEEVKIFLQKLQQIIRYLGISDADMEKGQMRCEPTVNLELEKDGRKVYTPLVELKNINSFRFVQKAIDFEIRRQIEEFESSGVEKQPGNKTTRGWSEQKGQTYLQRSKEEAEDYRYFPEPDIPPIRWSKGQIANCKLQITNLELPEEKICRFTRDYRLPETAAIILTETRQKADYFEKTVVEGKKKGLTSQEIANAIVNKRVDTEKMNPSEVVENLVGKKTPSLFSEKDLAEVIVKVIQENSKPVEDYKRGKTAALEFLVGQVAKYTKGQADLTAVRRILGEKLQAIFKTTP